MPRQFARAAHGNSFIVEEFLVRLVNVGGADRHRTIEENRKWLERAALERARQQIQEQLRTTNRKGRHEYPPTLLNRRSYSFARSDRGFCQRRVIFVAIGRFHKHEIRLLEGHWIAMER